jgi:site-specific DNA-methyltransferase (adenine-specific)
MKERTNGSALFGCTGALPSFSSWWARSVFCGAGAVIAFNKRKGKGRIFMELEIVYLSPHELTPYENNTRKHNPGDIDGIKKSIQDVGFRDPIGIWGKNNLIVEGHGRQLAAIELGMEKVPCIRLDDMTEEQRKEYAIRHNRSAEMSEWDFGKLEEELAALEIQGVDMSDLKFDLDVLSGGGSTEYSIAEDEPPEPPETPKSKLGDIYQLGRHRLMCGDSTDPGAWAQLMDGEKADMVFTDPPYGVAIGDKNATLNSVQPSGRCCENIEGDTMSESELYDMLKTAFINVRQNCTDDACYFVTSPQGGSLGLMMMMMRDAGLEVRHVLMWKKNSPTFSLGRLDYDYQHEPIFYTWTKNHHNFRNGEYRSTVWEYDKPRKCDLHPTMKPVELVANAIMDGTTENMIVLDAFCGSGTTIIAAEQTNRKARCMELDPHYVDVIIQRWENLTGEKAVLLNG